MATIITTILGFVLTGIIGNSLVQKWQYIHWIRQQRFSGIEKEYIAFRDLVSEISSEIGKRLFRMNRLFYAIRSGREEAIADKISAYDESLVSWNEKFNGFASKLTILSSFYETRRLEDEIQTLFFHGGLEMERLVKLIRSGHVLNNKNFLKTASILKKAQINAALFDRDLLKIVEEKRNKSYFGYNLTYNEVNLSQMSTFELVKALFVSDVDRHSVPRAP